MEMDTKIIPPPAIVMNEAATAAQLPTTSEPKKEVERMPAELEMHWPNYLFPVVTSSTLMFACWMIGHFQWSLLWILLFICLYVLKTHTWIRREQKRMSMRNMIMREREMVMAQYIRSEDLPAWVQFPDIERLEWVNKIIQQLWPYIGEYTKIFLREFIEPQIRSQMPSPFKSFKFVAVDMGDIPCRVGGLKVYTQNVGRDKVIMDMDVVYAGDAEFTIQTCGFQGGINQLVFSGKLRCTLQPLLPCPPLVGGISGAFIELPKVDFNLTRMGEFVQLPGLISAIRSVMNTQIANLAVLPNKIVMPLASNVDITRLYFPKPDGVIRLKIIEAMNLENKDHNFLNKKDISDPYCEIQVGSQVFRTKVINNNLNPLFNEYFEAVVDQASGQKLRIELFDKDTAGADEELGRLALPLDTVRAAGEIERWYHLEGCKHGELRLKVCWLNLSTNPLDKYRDDWESEWLGADKPMHSALLMVFLDSVANLPYPKSNLEPSPFVEFTLGRTTQRSPVKPKTTNPLYQTKFNFFVKQPEGQELKIRAVDDGTRREIGELTIPLAAVMREPNMEMNQQTFYLQYGVHSSPIVLTIRLNFFAPPKNVLESRELIHAYGTAVHIERSNDLEESQKADQKFLKDDLKKGIEMAEEVALSVNSSSIEQNGVQNVEFIKAILQNGAMTTTSPEVGKTVNKPDNELTPDIALNAHNTMAHSEQHPSLKLLPRTPSAASDRTTSSRSSKMSSRVEGFLGKLKLGAKHAKMQKHRNSTTSGAGKIQIELRYDQERFKLVVSIIAVIDLVPVEKEGHADPYIVLRLVPLVPGGQAAALIKSRKHTQIVRNTLNPVFDEEFEFDVHFTDMSNYKLQLVVKDSINYGLFAKQPILGMVEIPLQNMDPMKPISASQWLELISPQ